MLNLPPELQQAISAQLKPYPSERWIRDAQALSQRYRTARSADERPLASTDREALGYAVLILPSTYAQLAGAMDATAQRIPTFAPTTMLDLGSGPGTALWAATQQWSSLRQLRAWEREPTLIALGRRLAQSAPHVAVQAARWEQVDLQTRSGFSSERFDLVVLGHVLNELPPEAQAEVVNYAWRLTAGLLLIVEPGTSSAFAVARAARDQLLAVGANTIAPCPHNQPCPLVNDWCHFPQRLLRPPFQKQARSAPSIWEDAKYAYAAMARFPVEQPIWGRLIREPLIAKGFTSLPLCTNEGINAVRVQKRERNAYRVASDLSWGSAFDQPLATTDDA
jgi:ribosomal protein RSM22 (predicted rRNA methylase)